MSNRNGSVATGIDMKSMNQFEAHRVPSDPSDPSKSADEKGLHEREEEGYAVEADGTIDYAAGEITNDMKLDTALQLVTKALDITDEEHNTSAFTLRAFVIGIGLAAFGAVIAEIFYFKPQTVNVNVIFLQIIAFVFGEATTLIPRWGPLKWINPHEFSQKEHVFITIMASSAATCALGTEQLAVQSLYYNETPNAGSAIFMLLSSQMLGYGFLGGARKMFVYPTKMVWPTQLPLASLFQSLHLNKTLSKQRLRVFWAVCAFIIVWEIVPEYIFPLTAGISIFCLANQHSSTFTYLFGGANGNEGLGFLSWCMDWQYVGTSELVLPLNTLVNQLIGYIGCIILTTAAYHANLWNAKTFPFMAQNLFTSNGSLYNQSMILGADNIVNPQLLEEYGAPWFSMSNALSLLCLNMAVTAGIVHIICWNWADISPLFTWILPKNLKAEISAMKEDGRLQWKFWKSSNYVEQFPGTEGDAHFAAMRKYKEAPSWWYHVILILALIVGLVVTYQQRTQLPWWAFLIACLLSFVLLMFYAPLFAITGFYYQPTTAVQMIGGYMVPGRPVANMMFTLYASNSMVQGLLMLGDLKLAQYAKLPPRQTFTAQIIGTTVGAILNWVMMNSIVKNQRDILLGQPTNIWSGQNVQNYNAQAIAWGGTSGKVFSVGSGVYYMVPLALAIGIFLPLPFFFGHKFFPKLRLNYINTFLISNWLGWLSVGINSSLLPYFLFGFFSQAYLRKKRPVLFAKWVMITTAAIGGGVQIIIFILTFAVFGGSGAAHNFPEWWGNHISGNVDRCEYMNG